MDALEAIRDGWPSVAADLDGGVSVGDVRERASETLDGEEYGRLTVLLTLYAEQSEGTWQCQITMGNEAMRLPAHLSTALHKIADEINDRVALGGVVRDANGNTVGSYGLGEVV